MRRIFPRVCGAGQVGSGCEGLTPVAKVADKFVRHGRPCDPPAAHVTLATYGCRAALLVLAYRPEESLIKDPDCCYSAAIHGRVSGRSARDAWG